MYLPTEHGIREYICVSVDRLLYYIVTFSRLRTFSGMVYNISCQCLSLAVYAHALPSDSAAWLMLTGVSDSPWSKAARSQGHPASLCSQSAIHVKNGTQKRHTFTQTSPCVLIKRINQLHESNFDLYDFLARSSHKRCQLKPINSLTVGDGFLRCKATRNRKGIFQFSCQEMSGPNHDVYFFTDSKITFWCGYSLMKYAPSQPEAGKLLYSRARFNL